MAIFLSFFPLRWIFSDDSRVLEHFQRQRKILDTICLQNVIHQKNYNYSVRLQVNSLQQIGIRKGNNFVFVSRNN